MISEVLYIAQSLVCVGYVYSGGERGDTCRQKQENPELGEPHRELKQRQIFILKEQ